MTATINRWCYAFDDDRSPPVIKKPDRPVDADVFVVPAPRHHHCTYCHTVLAQTSRALPLCDDEKCQKKHARDKEIKRLDMLQQRAGGGLVQQGKNRQ